VKNVGEKFVFSLAWFSRLVLSLIYYLLMVIRESLKLSFIERHRGNRTFFQSSTIFLAKIFITMVAEVFCLLCLGQPSLEIHLLKLWFSVNCTVLVSGHLKPTKLWENLSENFTVWKLNEQDQQNSNQAVSVKARLCLKILWKYKNLCKFDLFFYLIIFQLKKFLRKKEISTTFPQFQAFNDATGVYENETVQIKE
jgi:hypothetical protein